MAKGGVCKTSIQRFDSARRLPFLACRFARRWSVASCLGFLPILLGVLPARLVAEAKVREGILRQVDTASRTVRVDHEGTQAAYRLSPTSTIILNKKPAALEKLPQGLKVAVRYRADAAEPYPAYDLVEAASWNWLQTMRREVFQGRVVSVDSRGVVIEDAREKGQLPYRVTLRSRIEINGRPATLADLKPGMVVWIAPRLLPTGGAMATGIADSEAVVLRLKERSQPTVTGTVTDWDATARTLRLKTVAGDDRTLTLATICQIRKDGKDADTEALKPGVYLTAHVRRPDNGPETVHRITLKAPPSARTGANDSRSTEDGEAEPAF